MLRACIVVLALAVATAAAGPLAAQSRSENDAYAVARFERGDLDGAAHAVAGWRSADFKDSLTSLAVSPDAWKRLEAAALFHTGLVVQRAIDEMRARYPITFYPQGPTEGWHELKVTANPRGDVRTRPGHFVTRPEQP